MPSRNNTIPWGDMRTSTYNGPCYGNKGIKMCMNWWICFIPCTQSWVLKIQRGIWCSSTTTVCTDTFQRKWSSSMLPHLAHHIAMPPRSSRNLSRRSENLDVRIQSQEKAPPNHRTRGKGKAGWLKMTPKRKIRTQGSGVNFITSPLTAQMSVGPNNRWWPN